MTSKSLLAYPNRADECILAGGSWEASLPRANLRTRVYQQVARTTDATNASTKFTFAQAKTRGVRVAALDYHNFSAASTYRFRLYNDAARTDLAYDSGVLPVFPTFYTEETCDWDSGNFWDLGLTEDERENLRTLLLHVLPYTVFARYGIFEIFDDGNTDGYVQAGRFFLSDAFVPAINMAWGAGVGYESRDIVDESDSGAEYPNARPGFRVARFRFEHLTEAEGMRILDMQRFLGSTGEVLYMWDSSDTIHLLRRSFIGRMRQLSAIEQAVYATMQTSFEIKEYL